MTIAPFMRFYYEESMEDGTFQVFQMAYILLIFLNIASILYYCLNFLITIRVRHYETNMQIIHQLIYATCPITSLFLIVNNVFKYNGMEQGTDPNDITFQVFQYTVTALMAPPLFCLPALMVERIFATIFINDYESNKRLWIGYIVVLVLFVGAAFSSYIFHNSDSIIIFVLFHIFLNFFSFLINHLLHFKNKQYYTIQHSLSRGYSLAERFQISDNIRIFKIFRKYLCILIFFTMACPALSLACFFDENRLHRNIYGILFEASFLAFTLLAPPAQYKSNVKFEKAMKSFFRSVSTKVEDSINRTKSRTRAGLRNTFGENMQIESTQQADVYFNQLRNSWNQVPNNK